LGGAHQNDCLILCIKADSVYISNWKYFILVMFLWDFICFPAATAAKGQLSS